MVREIGGNLGGLKMKTQIVIILIFVGFQVLAQTQPAGISETIRSTKAVVRYDFETDTVSGSPTNVDFIDTANSSFGAALNLRLYSTDRTKVQWSNAGGDGHVWIRGSTIIRSISNADKIRTECLKDTSTGLTIEAVVENNETVQERTGEFPTGIVQPLRIVSMSKDFTNRGTDANPIVNVNFALGQFYDMGDRYLGAATNSANANLFSNPIMTSNTSVMIQGLGRPATSYKQTIVFTLNKSSGFADLYLTDRYGNLFPAVQTQNGFGGNGLNAATYFDRWASGTYLNLANDYVTSTSTLTRSETFRTIPSSSSDADNPNRYWKGRIYRIAIYCEALTREQVLGDAYKIVKNQTFPIVNVAKTKNRLKAADIYERLTGTKTPIYDPLLGQMETKINGGDLIGAAALVTEHPLFYNIVARNFAGKMSNRDETINYPLNDFTATIIGMIRDNKNAKEMLTGNYFYMADPAKAAVPSDEVDDILRSNNHYDALDNGNFDLKAVLMERKQIILQASSSNGNNSTDNNNINNITFAAIDNAWSAGLLTTRQWAMSHMIAGTNRRAVEFTFREFMCTPIENMADSTGPEDPIGRDIDRNPGGSRSKFTTSCRACHTILDGFRPAFANLTFSNNFLKHSSLVPNSTNDNAVEDNSIVMRVHPDAAGVSRKMNHNEQNFINGKIIKTDDWVNNANNGTNKTNLGWGTKLSGKGTREFGDSVTASKAFSKCMTKRVFFTVCKRDPDAKDDAFIKTVADEFSSTDRNYNLKYLFHRIVTNDSCLGGN